MSMDLNLFKKLLLAVQGGTCIRVPSELFCRSEEQMKEEEQQFVKTKQEIGIIEYPNKQIEIHLQLLNEYKIMESIWTNRKITAFGLRFLNLLQNEDLLNNLQKKLGSTFDLYTPQTLASLAQQIDLHQKGFTTNKASDELRLPSEKDVFHLEELISYAKDTMQELAAKTNQASDTVSDYEEKKKELEKIIGEAELILYP